MSKQIKKSIRLLLSDEQLKRSEAPGLESIKKTRGRKRGTANEKTIFVGEDQKNVSHFLNTAVRDQRCQIRCNKGFIQALHAIIHNENMDSEADVLHKVLKYYAINKCTWMDKKIIKDI